MGKRQKANDVYLSISRNLRASAFGRGRQPYVTDVRIMVHNEIRMVVLTLLVAHIELFINVSVLHVCEMKPTFYH